MFSKLGGGNETHTGASRYRSESLRASFTYIVMFECSHDSVKALYSSECGGRETSNRRCDRAGWPDLDFPSPQFVELFPPHPHPTILTPYSSKLPEVDCVGGSCCERD